MSKLVAAAYATTGPSKHRGGLTREGSAPARELTLEVCDVASPSACAGSRAREQRPQHSNLGRQENPGLGEMAGGDGGYWDTGLRFQGSLSLAGPAAANPDQA